MNLTTNIPGQPPIRFQLSAAAFGAPAIEINCDLASQKYPDGRRRFDDSQAKLCGAWAAAWQTEPNIRIVRVSDLAIKIVADGATMTLRGETAAEHKWLAGWDACKVVLEVRGQTLRWSATTPKGDEKESAAMTAPSVAQAMRYEQMGKPALVTEAIKRGYGGYGAGGDMIVGGGADARSVPKHQLVKWLREYDALTALQDVDETFHEDLEKPDGQRPVQPAA